MQEMNLAFEAPKWSEGDAAAFVFHRMVSVFSERTKYSDDTDSAAQLLGLEFHNAGSFELRQAAQCTSANEARL